ncbi:MAG: proprotein convertase P-domain-containing protein, partial [Pseudomonadota bacterium]
QEILAFSARKNDPTSAGWQTNGAGLSFNHDYGFGLVDATAAVRMAETWTIQQTFDNRISVSQTQIVPVIINDLSTSSSTITYNSDYEIEHVLIDVNLSHSFIGDLVIRLISPDNTVSVLMDRPSLGLYTGSALDFEFSSTAHWGESTLGTWRLEIEDQAAGDTGFLIDWKINFIGNAQTADDLYVFTDDRLPSVINDTDGGVDTLNLSAVTSVVNVDLGNTSGHLIGAQAFSFGATTTIENLITGDANDIIEGSSADNILRGGRGNDRLIYTYADNLSATDSYDGDKGDDILQINFTASEFAGSILDDLRNFLDFIGLNADPNELNGTMYAFTSMNLTVSDIENLEVFVDGILTAVPPVVPVAPLLFIATAPAENFTGDILSDTVNFANSTDGVTVNLQNNTATGGFAQGDTLTSIENLTGTDFADRLTGNADNNTLRGGDDRDVLIGRDGNDKLVGGEGDDTIFGDAGDDELIGNQGFNNFYGGQGNDIFTGWGGFANARYDNDPNPVNINFATGIFEDGWGTFDTFFGIDRVFGSDFGDILMGGTSRIRLVGGLGDDTINGGSNLDILFGNEGMDTINGNGSKDEIFGGDDDDDIFGGDGPDKLFGDDGDDEIFGENGFDRLIGGLGFDTLDGGADKDRASYETSPNGINVDLLNGTADDGFGTQDTLINIEFIVGSDHNDTITGDNSNNLLSGGLGIDTIDGGLGDDTIEGEEGNDILFGYAGFDRLIGGAGNDTIDTTGNISARVSYETSTSGINVDLAGGSAQDGLGGVDTLIGVRRLEGSAESDTINGSDDRDFLYGMDEIDFIFGGLGNDIIEGGEGNDRLNGNGGFDQLTGDAGEDGFIFDADALIGTPDAVQDFDVTKDYLEIDSILSGYTSGVTPIEDFVMITDDGTDSFVMVDTDGGADSFTQIATLKNVTGLTDEAALISSGALVIV